MPLHSPKVTVRCGVGAFGIVGLYFFENDNEETVTVNSERYVTMLEGFVEPQLRRPGIDPHSTSFSAGWSNSPHRTKQYGCSH